VSARPLMLTFALAAACAHVEPPKPPLGVAPAPIVDPALFEAERITGGLDDLGEALTRRARTRRIQRVGWGAPKVEHHNCHTQSITVAGERVLTSCVDRHNGVAWLQIYRGRELAAFADGAAPEDVDVVRLRSGDLSHASVGQAVRGVGPNAGAALVPIAYEELGPAWARGPSVLEVRDADGRALCSIANERRGGLAAAALTIHDGRFWAVAVSHDELLVWRLDRIVGAGADCVAELVHAQRGDVVGDATWESYQGIALVIDRAGEIALLGGRGHGVDVWQLVGFGEPTMRAHRLARMPWRVPDAPPRGLLAEGMTVEQREDGRLRIWAVPGDYWRGVCLPARRDRRCARSIYYVDRTLESPALAHRDAPKR
jgi:hypothetical protein